MAIVFPEGTQNYPGVAHRFFYDEDVAHRAMSVGNNWYQIPGIELNIATRQASNRLMFLPSLSYCCSTINMEVGFAICQNGSRIGVGTGGTVGVDALDRVAYGIGDAADSHTGWKMAQWQQSLVYHPNTTSTITYSIQIRCRSSGTVNINRL